MKHYFFYQLFAVLAMSLFSCSTDDSENDGSGNTTDVAVTGKITSVGMSYALAEGYVNLDKLNAGTTADEMGIEYNGSGLLAAHVSTRSIEGRKISLKLTDLVPGTKYEYKTYVKVGKIYHYGETKAFTAKEGFGIATTGEATDLTFFSASLKAMADWSEIDETEAVQVGIVYAKDKDVLEKMASTPIAYTTSGYGYYDRAIAGYQMQNSRPQSLALDFNGLSSATQYYYSACTMIGRGCYLDEIKEFTTKSAAEYAITGTAEDVKMCKATLNVSFNLAGLKITDAGNVWYAVTCATSPEELENEQKRLEFIVPSAASGQAISLTADGLIPNTTYYYQAKVSISNDVVALGEVKTFSTQDLQQSGAVDMGTACQWATCDLGANAPEKAGDQYAFGETETKDGFNSYNYVYDMATLSSSVVRPKVGNNSGTEFDAATKQLGQPWRTPSAEEVKELNAKCQTKKGNYQGVTGTFALAENGNALFFPSPVYWSATLEYWSLHYNAQGFYLSDGIHLATYPYYGGLTIRPVQ